MNSFTKEVRNEVFMQSSSAQQYFYSDPRSGEQQYEIAKKYDLHTANEYKKFSLAVGGIILGFYRIEDTVPLLQQELGLDPRTAALLGADVLDFLAPLSDPNWVPPEEGSTAVEVADRNDSDNTAIPNGSTQTSEPIGEEAVVYRSEQDNVRVPLSSIPSYTHPPLPRTEAKPEIDPPKWRH